MKALTEKEIEALRKIANVIEDPTGDEIEEFSIHGAATLIHNISKNSIKIKVSEDYLAFVTRNLEKTASFDTSGRNLSDVDGYTVDPTSNNADEFEFAYLSPTFGKSAEKGQLQIVRNGSVYGTYKASYEDYYALTKRFIFCSLSDFGWNKDRITGEWMKEPFKNRKRGEAVVQNLFFSTVDEMNDYMAKQKKDKPADEKKTEVPTESGDELPVADSVNDVSMSDVDGKDGVEAPAPSPEVTPATATDSQKKSLPEQREEKAKKQSSKKVADSSNDTEVNGYKIKWNEMFKKYQVSHPEIGARIAEFDSIQDAKEFAKKGSIKTAEKDIKTIKGDDLAEYNRLKADGYKVDWTGEGRIQLSKEKGKEKTADSEEEKQLAKGTKVEKDNVDTGGDIKSFIKKYNIDDKFSIDIIVEGMKDESEHTEDKEMQFIIAMDHLESNIDYYKLLKSVGL